MTAGSNPCPVAGSSTDTEAVTKNSVKNIDLWQRLDEALTGHDIDWQWVKSHAGHLENEGADQLASEQAKLEAEALREI